jgi:hypothetical protein
VENVWVGDDREVLVSVGHVDGTAAVVLEEGMAWLSGYLEEGGATGLEDFGPAVAGLTAERTVEGGLLPPGAVSAEVVDRSGERRAAVVANGAWVIVLEEPVTGEVSPVRFADRDGRTGVPSPARELAPRAGHRSVAAVSGMWS